MADVTLDVGSEGPDVVFTETDARDVLGQCDADRVLVLLGKGEVSPEYIHIWPTSFLYFSFT